MVGKTLNVCERMDQCSRLDCEAYHPNRWPLNACPMYHHCLRLSCALRHPDTIGENRLRVLPDELLARIVSFLVFQDTGSLSVCSRDTRMVSSFSFFDRYFGLSRIDHISMKFRGDQVWHPFRMSRISLERGVMCVNGMAYKDRIHREKIEYMFTSISEVVASLSSNPHAPYLVEDDNYYRRISLGRRRMSLPVYKKGDRVDAMDEDGNWWAATIMDQKDGLYFVHFYGWDSKWDKWNDPLEIAPFRSVVGDWFSRLAPGENVEMRMSDRMWYMGVVAGVSADGITVRDLRSKREEFVKESDERIMPMGTHIHSMNTRHRFASFAMWSDPDGDEIWWLQSRNRSRVFLSRIPK